MKKWAVILFVLSGVLFSCGTIVIMAGSILENLTLMKLAIVFYLLGIIGITTSLIFIFRKKKNV